MLITVQYIDYKWFAGPITIIYCRRQLWHKTSNCKQLTLDKMSVINEPRAATTNNASYSTTNNPLPIKVDYGSIIASADRINPDPPPACWRRGNRFAQILDPKVIHAVNDHSPCWLLRKDYFHNLRGFLISLSRSFAVWQRVQLSDFVVTTSLPKAAKSAECVSTLCPKKTTLMLHTIDSTHVNRFR